MNKTKILADEEKCLAARNQAFIAYLTRRGLLADQQVTDEATKKRRQEAAKRAYHNTQLLLENYRDIAWALESMPNQIASELAMPFATLDELMFRIDLEIAMDNKKLESRLNSITKSRLLIDRIGGLGWEIDGKFMAHDFEITKNGQRIVTITKEWMTWGDSYKLDIANPEDEIVALAVVLTIDCVMESNSGASVTVSSN